MKVVIDTNRYTDFYNGVADVVRILEESQTVSVPIVVLAELRAGFLLGERVELNEGALSRFLEKQGVDVLIPDQQTTHHYAVLYRQLRRQGTPIPTNDIWIAALTIQHGLTLYTRDRHFDRLPQIPKL